MSSVTTTFDEKSSGTASSLSGWLKPRLPGLLLGLAASLVWLALAAVTYYVPDQGEFGRGPEFAAASAFVSVFLFGASLLGLLHDGIAARVRRALPWSLALGLFVLVWQIFAAKTGSLPQPFFPPPHALLEVFADDYAKLFESVVASVKLEMFGFLLWRIDWLPDRRVAGMVAHFRLLGASGHAADRSLAIDRLASHCLFCLSIQLERQHFSDRS